MALIRWQPWQELETLSRQVDELFGNFGDFDRPSLATRTANWTPAVELKGNDTEFVLRAELPGIDAKDLDINVSRNAVSISGESRSEHKTEDNGFVRSEFRYGKFQRVIPLPAAIENDQVKAEFKDGVLTLTLPRLQAVRPQVVKVSLSEAQPAASTATTEPTADAVADDRTEAKAVESETDDAWAA